MKHVAILIAAVLALSALPAAGQTASGTKSQPASDEIVQMRQEIASARKTYSAKVAEAKKTYDEAKAAAAKERDAAISAARATANQKKT